MVREDGRLCWVALNGHEDVSLVRGDASHVTGAPYRTARIGKLQLDGTQLNVIHWVHWHSSKLSNIEQKNK